MAPFSKGYNAQQFITEFLGKGWTMRSLDRLLVKLRKFGTEQPTGDRAADRVVHVLIKTSTHALFSVCSLRDDNVITSKTT